MHDPAAERATPRVPLIITILAVLALLGLAHTLAGRPPAPLPATAPADQFSAGRALQVLEQLLAEGVAHRVGTPENRQVRQRIEAYLAGLRLEPEVQRGFACSSRGVNCAWVENVMARIPGASGKGAIMLVSHYDSRGAGPGAADAGAAVAAVLETTRVLAAEAPFHHDIIVLLTDGEEVGLVGAELFTREHPWAADVLVAVNLEARGTGGPSIMFETSADNAWLVSAFAGAARRPVANSLTYDVYRLLPNDTDATVFRRAGMDVMNFAFIDELVRYHSAIDDLQHLDARSVQHHGDNALATVRALASAQVQPRAGDATYLDIFARIVLRWPASLTLPAMGLFTLLLGAVVVVWLRRGVLRFRRLAAGAAGVVLALLFALAVGWALGRGVTAAASPWGLHASAWLGAASLWAGALAAVLAAAALLGPAAGIAGLAAAVWMLLAAVTVALAAWLPGAAVVLVVPVAVATLSFVFTVLGPAPTRLTVAVAAAVAAIGMGFTILNLGRLLLSAFVLQMPLAIAGAIAVGALPLMPLAAVRREGGIVALAAAALAAVALGALHLTPRYTDDRPQGLNIVYVQDQDGTASWAVHGSIRGVGDVPAPLLEAGAFAVSADTPPPTSALAALRPLLGNAPRAAAPSLGHDGALMQAVADSSHGGRRTVHASLEPGREGNRILLMAPPGTLMAVDDVGIRPGRGAGGMTLVVLHGVPSAGARVVFDFPAGVAARVHVFDETPGLPPEGAPLQRARPRHARPIGDGDVTVVHSEIVF